MPLRIPALAFTCAAVMLAGCAAVGPDFKQPEATVPAAYADLGRADATRGTSVVTATPPTDARWWSGFDDPELNALLERARNGNLDYAQAVLRIVRSRLQQTAASAAGLPKVTGQGSYMREQLGLEGVLKSHGAYDAINGLGAPNSPLNGIAPGLGNQVQTTAEGLLNALTSPVNLYQLGFDASWELDLFGRVRRSVEAAGAEVQASEANADDALISLQAEVAQTYYQLRGAQELRAIVSEQAASAQTTFELISSRAAAGLDPYVDVDGAHAQFLLIQAQLPAIEQQIELETDRLAILTGTLPGSLDDELKVARALPSLPPVVPVGLPASLVRRRPDIRAAEANLHAATAEVGVAVAQLFPDVSLTGQFGLRATQANYLTRWSSHFYSFGPSISVPVFEGGALVTGVKLANVQQAQAALMYRSTVLNAIGDADGALIRYRTDQARADDLQKAVSVSANAFDLSRESWRHGLVAFITVLDAERQYTSTRQQYSQARTQAVTDLIALYKALGGGWSADPLAVSDGHQN